ncbi:MAG: DUF4493 domain-containing protein, partial [Parabacteroides sp.]
MSKYIYSMALFTLCYLLTACVAEELQGPVAGSGEGYLVLQLGSVSAEVQSAPLTKTGEKTTLTDLGVTIPSVDAFTITIKDSEGSTFRTASYGELKQSSSIVLPVGTYTVEASHGDNQALQDKPYFYGSGSVTITTGSNSISLTPKLANAVIIPVVTEDLQKHYNDGWTLTANNKPLDKTSNGIQMFYAKAGETISFTFQGTNKAGQQSTTTWTVISSVAAYTAYTVQCNPDLSAFSQIQITAEATHTYDTSDYLNGTDVKLNCNLNGANAEAIQTWNVQVMYNGTAIRTYSGSTPNNLTMTPTEGWPYIPQGSTLSTSVTLKAGDIIQLTNSSFSSLPLPTFGITVSGETSYSVYKQSGASEANQKDGSSIFNIGSTLKISKEILDKYPELLSTITYSASGEKAIEANYGTNATISELSWKQHQLTASVTFDLSLVSSVSFPCDVTGLPYKPINMIETDWMFASWNCKYQDGVIQLGNILDTGECTATSTMAFNIPNNINVSLTTTLFIHCGKYIQTEFTASINGRNVITIPKTAGDNNYTKSATGVFEPDKCSIQLNSSY